MTTRLSQARRKSTTQWPDQIRLYHSTVQQLPHVAYKRHAFLLCVMFYSQASHTVMDSNRSTALFEIPRLSAQQGGLWECRVSTHGGQDSHKFNLTIKGLCVWFLLSKVINREENILFCDHFQYASPSHNSNTCFAVSTQSPLCPLLLPNCWKKGVSSC